MYTQACAQSTAVRSRTTIRVTVTRRKLRKTADVTTSDVHSSTADAGMTRRRIFVPFIPVLCMRVRIGLMRALERVMFKKFYFKERVFIYL